jgi:hypothetical protein
MSRVWQHFYPIRMIHWNTIRTYEACNDLVPMHSNSCTNVPSVPTRPMTSFINTMAYMTMPINLYWRRFTEGEPTLPMAMPTLEPLPTWARQVRRILCQGATIFLRVGNSIWYLISTVSSSRWKWKSTFSCLIHSCILLPRFCISLVAQEGIQKGIPNLSVYMYVIREMEHALDTCIEDCQQEECLQQPVQSWDSAVALYVGVSSRIGFSY